MILYSATERGLLEREAASRRIHALEDIEVNLFEPAFLESLEKHLEKHLELELVRNQVLSARVGPGDSAAARRRRGASGGCGRCRRRRRGGACARG